MIEKNTLVSIIVPVYGTEAYLPACIDSICKQSYTNLQIILVDDQSPDRCPQICDAYAETDERILVIHQENKGVSGARNTGMSYAVGDYFMFVDSDDELYPEAVEILLDDILFYSADMVSAVKSLASADGRILNIYEDYSLNIYSNLDMLKFSLEGEYQTYSACAKMFKNKTFRDVRFIEGKNINEDGFFLFQCYMLKSTVVQHNIAVYQYNIREGSSSRQIFSDKYLSMLYFCDRKKEIISAQFPQYNEHAYNMEARTNLQLLDILCSTVDKKHKQLQEMCIKRVRELYKYHKPINEHHKKLAWVVKYGLYPIYKIAVRLKYYR